HHVNSVQLPCDDRFSHAWSPLVPIRLIPYIRESPAIGEKHEKNGETPRAFCGGIFEEIEAKKGPAPAFSAGAGKLPAEGRCRTRFVSRGKIIPLFVDFPPAASETPGVRG